MLMQSHGPGVGSELEKTGVRKRGETFQPLASMGPCLPCAAIHLAGDPLQNAVAWLSGGLLWDFMVPFKSWLGLFQAPPKLL